MKKIVILDGYASNPGDLSWDELKTMGELTVYPRTKKEEVIARIGDAEIILTNKVAIDEVIMTAAPNLKYIGVLATGYNIVDVAAANRHGIMVTNIPAYSTDSVVQIVFAHILNITNQVAHYAQESRDKRWCKSADFCYWDTPLTELSGKTIGIVGLGNIGMKVAQTARCFGMDVFACTSKNSADLPQGIMKTTFDGLLSVADIITLHCPLTPDTYHKVNGETLKHIKPGAILINTGRGPLVDELAVAEALKSGQLGAYGADVMEQEPPAAGNPLLDCDYAYITPHVAWATFEARQRLNKTAINNVRAYLSGVPTNTVKA